MASRQYLFLPCVIISIIVSSVGIEMKADKCMKKQMPFVIACDIGLITEDVFFYNNEAMIVTCVPPGQSCDTATTTCSLSKDNSTALLVIDAVDCKTDSGDWYCGHGKEISSKFKMDCSQCGPCVGFAMATMTISCILMGWNILSLLIMFYKKCEEHKTFKFICIFMEIISVIVGIDGATGLAMFCESREMDEDEAMMHAGMTLDIMSSLLGIALMLYQFVKSSRSHKSQLPRDNDKMGMTERLTRHDM